MFKLLRIEFLQVSIGESTNDQIAFLGSAAKALRVLLVATGVASVSAQAEELPELVIPASEMRIRTEGRAEADGGWNLWSNHQVADWFEVGPGGRVVFTVEADATSAEGIDPIAAVRILTPEDGFDVLDDINIGLFYKHARLREAAARGARACG